MNKTPPSPNFFIVGAAKCGTTALYQYLSQHPDVHLSPIKEPNHFSIDIRIEDLRPETRKRLQLLEVGKYIEGDMRVPMHRAFVTDREQYLRLFRFAKDQKAIGEASASYLFSKTAAAEIHEFNPDARIIILLRNPVDRAFSHYQMDQRMAITTGSFEQALEEDRKRPVKNWGSASLYLELGYYAEQVRRYLDQFARNQILFLLSDELRGQPQATLNKVCEFLDIAPFTFQNDREANVSSLPRNSIVRRLIRIDYLRVKVRRAIRSRAIKSFFKNLLFKSKDKAEKMSKETESRLKRLYADDLTLLSALTGKDLSVWMKDKGV